MTPGQAAGRVVRELRLSAGWTQDATARRLRSLGLDWSRDQLTVLETGRRQDLTITEAVLLAEAFGISVSALLADHGQVDVGSRAMSLAELRERLSAPPPSPVPGEETAYSVTERAWARQLGLLPEELRVAAAQEWKQTADEQIAAVTERLVREGRPYGAALAEATREAFTDLQQTLEAKVEPPKED